MRTRLVFHEDFATVWEPWLDLSKSSPPFLRPGWIRAWYDAFGRGGLCVAALHRDNDIVALVPLRRRRGGVAGLTNAHSQLFGILGRDARSRLDLMVHLMDVLPPAIELRWLAAGRWGAPECLDAAHEKGYRMVADLVPSAPVVDLGSGWEAYESSLRGKLRAEIRRRKRRLAELGTLRLEVLDGETALARLDEGIEVEASGWKGREGTAISARPATLAFYRSMARWGAECGWLRVAFLRLNQKALAFDLCLECEGTHYLLKTGFDEKFRTYAPGILLRHEMLRRAFTLPLHTYDFLGDDYEWKREWSSVHRDSLHLYLFAPTLHGTLDLARFKARREVTTNLRNAGKRVLTPQSIDRIKEVRGTMRKAIAR